MTFADIWPWIKAVFVLSLLVTSFTIAYMVIRQNGNPAKTITWILLITFLPLIGVGLYFTFGINYRRQKLYKRKKTHDRQRYQRIIDNSYYQFEKIDWIKKEEVAQKQGLAKLLLKSSKSLFTDRNHVEILQDGPITFERIFEALERAESFIHIQYYIFRDGELAEKFLELFERKLKAGVEIRLIYDAVGSWSLSKEFKERLSAIGVQHSEFLPVRFVQVANKINYRNHRKIVVVDGVEGFTGGINVADKYLHGDHLGQWRDTFVHIRGNAVNGLQYLFLNDWNFACDEDLVKEEYFRPDSGDGHCAVQIVGSGPDSDYPGIMKEYDTLIHSSQDYIYFSNPYLIPGEVIESALITAAMRGVDVRIMIPGISDFKIVKWSTNSYLTSLLRAGVKIYRYNKGFLHSKTVVSDDVVSSIGTGNMDIRSFELNFEVNAVVYDSSVAQKLKQTFLEDCGHCSEVVYEEWRKRPLRQKLLESLSRLVSPLL